jgi:hypothetical protein
MRLPERLMQLLALEMQVMGRGYHAQDHEGVEEVRELDEVQEVEGLCGGLRSRRSQIGGSEPVCAMCCQAMDGTSSLGTSSKGPSSFHE